MVPSPDGERGWVNLEFGWPWAYNIHCRQSDVSSNIFQRYFLRGLANIVVLLAVATSTPGHKKNTCERRSTFLDTDLAVPILGNRFSVDQAP